MDLVQYKNKPTLCWCEPEEKKQARRLLKEGLEASVHLCCQILPLPQSPRLFHPSPPPTCSPLTSCPHHLPFPVGAAGSRSGVSRAAPSVNSHFNTKEDSSAPNWAVTQIPMGRGGGGQTEAVAFLEGVKH